MASEEDIYEPVPVVFSPGCEHCGREERAGCVWLERTMESKKAFTALFFVHCPNAVTGEVEREAIQVEVQKSEEPDRDRALIMLTDKLGVDLKKKYPGAITVHAGMEF